MLRRDDHGVKELCEVAAAQVAHTHTVERLGAMEVHAQQVAGGAVLRPLSTRRLFGASVVASSGVAAAVCDQRPVSGSEWRAPKRWPPG
jgi:hypothetical protein